MAEFDPKAHIVWRPVDSSNVAQVGWPFYPDSHIWGPVAGEYQPKLLLIRFKDGRCFGYLGASKQRAVYMATRCASVGRYVNEKIKPHFEAVRIPELDAKGPPF